METWIAPGSATAAVIFVVVIMLRHIRYLYGKHEKQINALQTQLQYMEVTRNTNEERRMNQVQGLFDKFSNTTIQMVQGTIELKHAFAVFTVRIGEQLAPPSTDKNDSLPG